MIRILAMIVLFVPACFLVPISVAGDKVSIADDRKKLQGVWQSSAETKQQLKIMFMGDKIGYEVTDPTAKPGAGVLNFLALSAAKHLDSKGKRQFDIEIAKDYVKRVAYRFEKDDLVITADGTDYKVTRASTQASTNADAKKLVGTWKIIEIEQKGKKQNLVDLGLDAIIITEDRYMLVGPGDKELLSSFYRVDASKKPASMDWYGMKPSFVIPLIYEIKDNEIRLAHPPFDLIAKGAPRPASFDTKGADVVLFRAERKK